MPPGVSERPCNGVHLVLSGRCNLACGYCYQGPRCIPPRMPWSVALRALDFLLAEGTPPLTVDFGGGEPLLEFGLLRRCVDYVEARRPGAADYIVTTNGTLLTRERYRFFASHRFSLRLSFDGPERAQGRRGPGTFEKLDGALQWMREADADYFETGVRVAAVLGPETAGAWSEAAAYFLDSGAATVSFSPVMGGGDAFTPEAGRLLLDQALAVAERSAAHWERTGKVPVAFLREPGTAGRPPSRGGFACNAGAGGSLCVSTDGEAWTCPLYVPGLQRHTAMASQAAEALYVGNVRAPGLRERLSGVPRRAAAFPFLASRSALHSGLGRCGECELLAECSYCPACVSHVPGNADPTKVPDFQCAFARAVAGARTRFQELTGRRAGLDHLVKLEAALRNLASAVERDLGKMESGSRGNGETEKGRSGEGASGREEIAAGGGRRAKREGRTQREGRQGRK